MIPKFKACLKLDKKIVDVREINYKYKEIAWADGMYTEVDNFEDIQLLQFTGLKDKNGVEIFEGDVVKVTDESWGADFIVSNVIWFGDTEWQYPAFDLNGLYIPKDFHFETNALNTCILENEVEIIGNQFEHPHLLEE